MSQSKHGRHGDVRNGKTQSESKTKSLWSRMTLRRSVSDSGSELGSDVNAVIGGVPACIFGQLCEVIMFMEPLLDAQVQSLFALGQFARCLRICFLQFLIFLIHAVLIFLTQ